MALNQLGKINLQDEKILFPLFAVAVLLSASCSKSTPTNGLTKSSVSNQTISDDPIKEIEQYSKDFKRSKDPSILRPSPYRTMLADALGSLSGAGLGPIGACIGGICGSLLECSTFTVPSNQQSYNSNNPYDIAGVAHNPTLINAMQNPNEYIVNNQFNYGLAVSYITTYLNANYTIPGSTTFDVSSFVTYVQGLETVLNNNGNYYDAINYMHNNGYIDATEKDILDPYFNAMCNFTSNTDKINYSVGAEAIITASSTLTTNQKQRLLICMAIARNSGLLEF